MKRIAIIDQEKCRPSKCNYKCMKTCPVYRFNKEVIKLDEKQKPVISEILCTGCGICQKFCPFGAIKIVRLPEEEEEKLLHKYPSGFRLYGLPPIKMNSVVGILGPNGTGKTTTVSILSGSIIPNFGKDEASKEYVLERFKKTEYYQYFEKLYNEEIKVVVKPQNISAISTLFANKYCREIIEQYDEENIAKDILEEFEYSEILNKRVKELSGGGLQILAITVALSRSCDVLFLDEPSIYLDVKRRFKLLKLIKEYKKETTFLVDHDLIVLDGVSDYVCILFGEPGAFGMYSSIKSTKNGINEFLNGYLKEENVRIRSKPISFRKRVRLTQESMEIKTIVEYDRIVKKLGTFELEVEPGKISSHDIIGVVGENCIGKSTFARILAKELEPDQGKVIGDIKISYKPQEITYQENTTVKEFIGKFDAFIKNEVMSSFDIIKLLDLELNSLSGGELQKVWILRTLARDADLYILDEPSAFLDVENRVKLAKILANFIEKKRKAMFIVDHDLQIIDYVCGKVIVFSGKPNEKGKASSPMDIKDGLNEFLKNLNITFRRDVETYRLRINDMGSRKDVEQKEQNIYYPM